jgi:hypothetical protein
MTSAPPVAAGENLVAADARPPGAYVLNDDGGMTWTAPEVSLPERRWFRELVAGQELEPIYDPALDKDADFEDLDPDRAQADYERLLEECQLADEALAAASYEDTITARAGVMSVRTVVVHMIEEYAQHNGHADLLRERIDGTTDKRRPAC